MQGKRVLPLSDQVDPHEDQLIVMILPMMFNSDVFNVCHGAAGINFHRPGNRYILTRNFKHHIVCSFGTRTCCKMQSRIWVTCRILFELSAHSHIIMEPLFVLRPFKFMVCAYPDFFFSKELLASWVGPLPRVGLPLHPDKWLKLPFVCCFVEAAGGSLVNTTTGFTLHCGATAKQMRMFSLNWQIKN